MKRGFASITAIIMIGLVGVTLATIAVAFVSQAKRTRGEAIQAQVRQMVIAGQMGVTKLPAEIGDGEIVVSGDEITVKWRGKVVAERAGD